MRCIQVNNTHRCAGCGAHYVPYDKVVPCPQCGMVEKARCDFVGTAVRSLLYNLEHYDTFLPSGWVAQSFADYVLAILLQVFHTYAASGTEKSFYEFSRETLEEYVSVSGREYLLEHIHAMGVRMSEELAKQCRRRVGAIEARPGTARQRSEFTRL